MPTKGPRICGCGHRIKPGHRCPCEAKRDQERKARFDKTRPNSTARGYGRAWETARRAFLRRNPFCRRCGAPAAVVDHKTPHRGDQTLFWDQDNWQPLCTPCHSGAKQSEERRDKKRLS